MSTHLQDELGKRDVIGALLLAVILAALLLAFVPSNRRVSEANEALYDDDGPPIAGDPCAPPPRARLWFSKEAEAKLP